MPELATDQLRSLALRLLGLVEDHERLRSECAGWEYTWRRLAAIVEGLPEGELPRSVEVDAVLAAVRALVALAADQ